MAKPEPLTEEAWESVQQGIKKLVRPLPFDVPKVPPGNAIFQKLTKDRRTWCMQYVATGSSHEANKEAHYLTPGPQTANRLLPRTEIRHFIALVYEGILRRMQQEHQRAQDRKLAPVNAAAVVAIERIEAAPVLPEQVQAIAPEFEHATGKIAELLNHSLATVRAKAGDFIEMEVGPDGLPTGIWKVDVVAVKNAPPGVIRAFSRDPNTGEMKIVMADPDKARDSLMDFLTTASGFKDKDHADVRAVMLKLISGDSGTWAQTDALAKNVQAQLRAAREKAAPRAPTRVRAAPIDVTPVPAVPVFTPDEVAPDAP